MGVVCQVWGSLIHECGHKWCTHNVFCAATHCTVAWKTQEVERLALEALLEEVVYLLMRCSQRRVLPRQSPCWAWLGSVSELFKTQNWCMCHGTTAPRSALNQLAWQIEGDRDGGLEEGRDVGREEGRGRGGAGAGVRCRDEMYRRPGMLVGRRAKLETALLIEAGFGGGVGLAGRGMLDLGVWEEEPEGGPSVWVCVEALGSTRRGTRGRWPGADSGLAGRENINWWACPPPLACDACY
ncbi:hypothetical protein E2C01_023060 [Portunus trituberculatus]|uniref:Uncharacterized protein n=1 Tax=Portunus trituberculatus TaxID=210409 RepID=A0A5B7E8R2_PORTR|nr:hypothetical protein [Portunus trituberculatus]